MDKIKIINCTPYEVIIHSQNGIRKTYKPSGIIPRFEVKRAFIGQYDGVDIFEIKHTNLEDLPPTVEGTMYIVSPMTAQTFPERKDFLMPGEHVKNPEGRVIGYYGLNIWKTE